MDDINLTTDAVRPDLAALEVNPPEEYIGEQLMPTIPVYQPSGDFYYHAKPTVSAAQTDREDAAAPDTEQLANTYVSFSVAEIIKRVGIVPKQVPVMGGIENADKIGGKASKRKVMAAREAIVAGLVLGIVNATFDPGAVTAQAAAARAATKGIAGKLTLVGSSQTLADLFMALVREDSTSALISRIVSGTAPGVAMEGLDPAIQAKAAAILLGCSAVLAGDDEIWNAGDLEGRFAIGRFDSGEEGAHLWQPVFGRVLQYLPEGQAPLKVSSYPDKKNINNLYTADTQMVAKVLNASGVYAFSLS